MTGIEATEQLPAADTDAARTLLALSHYSCLLYLPWLGIAYLVTGLNSVKIARCGWDGDFFATMTVPGGAVMGLILAVPSWFGAAVGLAASRHKAGRAAVIATWAHLLLGLALVLLGVGIAHWHVNPFAM